MPTNDVSLNGVKKYIEDSKGSLNKPDPHLSRDLNDLKNLVNELVSTRVGASNVYGCNCHGHELHNGYSKTTCGSNVLTSNYSKSTISLGELLNYIEPARGCSCVAVKVEDCVAIIIVIVIVMCVIVIVIIALVIAIILHLKVRCLYWKGL